MLSSPSKKKGEIALPIVCCLVLLGMQKFYKIKPSQGNGANLGWMIAQILLSSCNKVIAYWV